MVINLNYQLPTTRTNSPGLKPFPLLEYCILFNYIILQLCVAGSWTISLEISGEGEFGMSYPKLFKCLPCVNWEPSQEEIFHVIPGGNNVILYSGEGH